jgi:hypothetical protein
MREGRGGEGREERGGKRGEGREERIREEKEEQRNHKSNNLYRKVCILKKIYVTIRKRITERWFLQ